MGRSIALILGGVSSGKRLRPRPGFTGEESCISCYRAPDEEMRRKIQQYLRERPPGWKIVETRFGLDDAIAKKREELPLLRQRHPDGRWLSRGS